MSERSITELRAVYAEKAAAYSQASDAVEAARLALDSALLAKHSHRVGHIIPLTGGSKLRIDRITTRAGRVYGAGPWELGTGGWSKRFRTVLLNVED